LEKAGKQGLDKKEKILTIFQGLAKNKLTMLDPDNFDWQKGPQGELDDYH